MEKELPHYVKNTRCHYVPIAEVGVVPDWVPVCCRWGEAVNGHYERAYTKGGKWFLVFNDKEMPAPTAIQRRKTWG